MIYVLAHVCVCVQVNPERVGFYRVAYSSEMFSSLTSALASNVLSAEDRLGLQNDALALVSSPDTPTLPLLGLYIHCIWTIYMYMYVTIHTCT